MKKSLGLKICAGLLAVPILGTFCRGAFATTNSILKVGNEDIYTANGKESNNDETATYDATTKTLTLKKYQGKAIDTDIASLTIKVAEASTITDTVKSIHSTGNLIVTGEKLTVSNGIDTEGGFTLDSGNVDLGATDLTAKGTIKINGTIKAGSISLTAESPAKAKIMFDAKADVTVSKDITANYTTKITTKGIELNKVCANAQIINLEESGKSTASTTVFSSDGKVGVTKGVKIASSVCDTKTDTKTNDKENPDTADSIYFYVAALVASSAILVYRRRLAKH
ncbi:MAG: hypothetical protein K6G36_01290 [Candidatus Saccharibacteria bacterium]|nr:hypothetical protein [Candidatus Saccharibacteria bacterium]